MTVKIPQRGDVIRRGRTDSHWYGVVIRARRESCDYVHANGTESTWNLTWGIYEEDASTNMGAWCFANPNRLDHMDIPDEIWDLRRRVLAGEIP